MWPSPTEYVLLDCHTSDSGHWFAMTTKGLGEVFFHKIHIFYLEGLAV